VPQSSNRCVRWLRGQLPALVSAGVITPDASKAIEQHYAAEDSRSRNIGIVLLAIVGSALVAAGIILLIAHNWDDLSRPTRSVIAFLPLIVAQAVAVFVLIRRDESQASRESIAIFEVAAVATAISLVSQTYQIQGSFADFMFLWLLLSLPIVYLFRTTLGAVVYIIGSVVWLSARTSWFRNQPDHLFFWLFLLAIVPYYIALFWRDRFARQTAALSIVLAAAAGIGLGYAAEFTQANIGAIAFAGFFTAVYLCGIKFFPREDGRLSALALLGGIGVGATAVVLSFEGIWHFGGPHSWNLEGAPRAVAIGIQLFFPVAAIALLAADYMRRNRVTFSVAAGALPLVAGLAWIIANQANAGEREHDNSYAFAASVIFNLFALLLGVELLARGVRADSTARANFGLLVIVALAMARFFDSDLSFVTRGLGFIAVGVGFLVANVILFRKRAKT
jgi:uncharacterized membrane protein